MKKIILIILTIIISIMIYTFTYNKNIDYLALGDGIAKGKTYYYTTGYGYSDYISKYLEENKSLKSFNKI